ncbi:unnamed protein product [Scytosiphon promiscuus]
MQEVREEENKNMRNEQSVLAERTRQLSCEFSESYPNRAGKSYREYPSSKVQSASTPLSLDFHLPLPLGSPSCQLPSKLPLPRSPKSNRPPPFHDPCSTCPQNEAEPYCIIPSPSGSPSSKLPEYHATFEGASPPRPSISPFSPPPSTSSHSPPPLPSPPSSSFSSPSAQPCTSVPCPDRKPLRHVPSNRSPPPAGDTKTPNP